MRFRTPRRIACALCVWQLLVLLAAFVPAHLGDPRPPQLSTQETFLVSSLIHPSDADLEASITEVSFLKRPPCCGLHEPWQADLVALLREQRWEDARTLMNDRHESIRPAAKERIDALTRLPATNADLEFELAAAVQDASPPFSTLHEWLWSLWDRSATDAHRALISNALSSTLARPEAETMMRAALRFASRAQPASKSIASQAFTMGENFNEAGQPALALALYRQAERLSNPGPVWGSAVLNRARLLHASGCEKEARAELQRLIASSVDDKDPGDLITTNRNYRFHAAYLIAETYRSEHAYLSAYQWRLLAADRYKYYSWCGTCTLSVRQELNLTLFRDALTAGPAVLAAHLTLHAKHAIFLWT